MKPYFLKLIYFLYMMNCIEGIMLNSEPLDIDTLSKLNPHYKEIISSIPNKLRVPSFKILSHELVKKREVITSDIPLQGNMQNYMPSSYSDRRINRKADQSPSPTTTTTSATTTTTPITTTTTSATTTPTTTPTTTTSATTTTTPTT